MIQVQSGFIERLNAKLQANERIFKVHKAELAEQSFVITLLVNSYDYKKMVNAEFKERLYQFALEILPSELPLLTIKYKKTITDEDIVLRTLLVYIYDEFNILTQKVSKDFIDIDINKNTITIRVRMPRYIYNFCESNQFADKVTAYLEHEFMESVECELIVDDTLIEETLEPQNKSTKQMLGLIEAEVKESILPGVIAKAPIYIKNAKLKPSSDVVICGKVKSIMQKQAKSSGKPFFTLILDDTTDAINVTVFPRREQELDKLAELEENEIIIASGNIKFSIYERANSMIANKLSYCSVDFDKLKKDLHYKDAPEEYQTITPQPYIEQEQAEIFDILSAPVADTIEYVVFDFETTGLYISEGAEPIELGAVKIKDGKIVEQFNSFIKINKPLSKEIVNLTGITDKDLKNAPTIDLIIADFFKFTRGATLIGHNIAFDMTFLDKYSKPLGYVFDNDIIDTLNLARLKIKSKDYKLATLIEEFNIQNHIAHRAAYDAIATAKLFLRLNNMVDL